MSTRYQAPPLQKAPPFLGLSLLLLFFLPHFFAPQASADAPAILLGGIFDLSSEAGKVWGTAERNGFLLAIDSFKQQHPNRQVDALVEDSQYSNAKAVTAFHKLTSVSKVRYIVGPTFEVFVAVMPLCARKKVICFAPSQHSSEFHSPALVNRFAFTAWFDERGYADTIAKHILENNKRSVVIFGARSPYHDTLVDTLAARLKQNVSTIERVQPQDFDFRTLILRAPRSVDSVVLFFPEENAFANFIAQWHQLRPERPTFYADDTVAYLPPELASRVQSFSPKIYYSSPQLPDELNHKFNELYRNRFKSEPESPSAAVAFDETTILLRCIHKHDDVDAVRQCIAETKDFQGFSGNISFEGRQSVSTRDFQIKTYSPSGQSHHH